MDEVTSQRNKIIADLPVDYFLLPTNMKPMPGDLGYMYLFPPPAKKNNNWIVLLSQHQINQYIGVCGDKGNKEPPAFARKIELPHESTSEIHYRQLQLGQVIPEGALAFQRESNEGYNFTKGFLAAGGRVLGIYSAIIAPEQAIIKAQGPTKPNYSSYPQEQSW